MLKKRICAGLLLAVALVFLPEQLLGYEDWFKKGVTSLRSNRFDEAVNAFSITLEIVPHDFESYNNRGVAMFFKGELDKAIADFTEGLRINAQFAEAYCNRGITWFHKGRYDLTIADSTEALKINPGFFQAYLSRAAARTKIGNNLQAIEDYNRARELNPTYAWARPSGSALSGFQYQDANRVYKDAVVLQLLHKEIKADGLDRYLSKLRARAAAQKASAPKVVATAAVQTPVRKTKAATPPAPTEAPALVKTVPPTSAPLIVHNVLPKTDYPFSVHVSSFKSSESSNRVALAHIQKGDAAFSYPMDIPDRGLWYRVFIGYYETKEAAETAAADLLKRKFRYAKAMQRPYAMQLEIPSAANALAALKADLALRGYIPYVLGGGDGRADTRFLIGAYRNRKQAEVYAKTLLEAGYRLKVVRR